MGDESEEKTKKRPVDDSCGTERERDQLWPTFLLSFLIAMLCHALLAVRPSLIRQRVWRELTTFTRFRFFVFVPQVPNIFDQKEKKNTKKRKRKSNWNMMFSPHYVRRLYSTFVLYNQEAANCPRILIWLCVLPRSSLLFFRFFFKFFAFVSFGLFGGRLYHEFHIASFAERYSSNGDERRISLWKRFWFKKKWSRQRCISKISH